MPRFSLAGYVFRSDTSYYYLVWTFVILSVAICRNIDRSYIGRALRAISVTEAGAASVGIDIARHGFNVVSPLALSSIACSLIAHYLRIIGAAGVQRELQLQPPHLGHYRRTDVAAGGVIGTFALLELREALRVLSLPLVELLIVGIVTAIAPMIAPRGLVGLFEAATRRCGEAAEYRAAKCLRAQSTRYRD